MDEAASELRRRPRSPFSVGRPLLVTGRPIRWMREQSNRFGPTMDAQLVEDIVDVILDRCHFDAQSHGDLLVRETLAHERRDLALTAGQERHRPVAMVLSGELCETPYESSSCSRGTDQLAIRRTLNRRGELLNGTLPRDVGCHAHLGAREHARVRVADSDGDEWDSGRSLRERDRHFIEIGYVYVSERHVCRRLIEPLQRVASRRFGGDHGELIMCIEQLGKTLAIEPGTNYDNDTGHTNPNSSGRRAARQFDQWAEP